MSLTSCLTTEIMHALSSFHLTVGQEHSVTLRYGAVTKQEVIGSTFVFTFLLSLAQDYQDSPILPPTSMVSLEERTLL